jgi:hypothetical protein
MAIYAPPVVLIGGDYRLADVLDECEAATDREQRPLKFEAKLACCEGPAANLPSRFTRRVPVGTLAFRADRWVDRRQPRRPHIGASLTFQHLHVDFGRRAELWHAALYLTDMVANVIPAGAERGEPASRFSCATATTYFTRGPLPCV